MMTLAASALDKSKCFGGSTSIRHPHYDINVAQALAQRRIEETHTGAASPSNDDNSVAEFKPLRHFLKKAIRRVAWAKKKCHYGLTYCGNAFKK